MCPDCGVAEGVTSAAHASSSGVRRWWAWPLVIAPIVVSVPVALGVGGGGSWAVIFAIDWIGKQGSGWPLLLQIPMMLLLLVVLLLGLAIPLSIGIFVYWDVDARLPRAHRVRAPREPSIGGAGSVPRGTVRCATPLRAPLSGTPCAGFEIRTRGPTGTHRDAVATPFVLEMDGDATLRIEPGSGTWLDLPPGTRARLGRERASAGDQPGDHPELRRLCRSLGLGVALGPLDVEERVLALDARIEVRGGVAGVVAGDDYRGSSVETRTASVEAPMIIRASSP